MKFVFIMGLIAVPSESKLQLLQLLKEKAIANARDNFLAFVRLMAPIIIPENFVEGKHIHMICEKLQMVERGEIDRLMIFMPPRSMKSRLASILFPAWVLGRHSMWDMMSLSYSKELAMDFSREVRNLVKTEDYLEIFPFMGLRADSKATFRWHTTGGGQYTAGGIKSGIAGKGAHVALIDDPLSEQDAISDSARNFVKAWYPGGLRSRLAPGGKIIVITTRWHTDDLAGWLLKQQESGEGADKWEVLDIPGLIETDAQVKLFGYPKDTTYWPERWPTETLLRTKANMPPHQWNALYQQHPTSQEGGVFKKHWFQDWPYKEPPKCDYIVQSYDTAFSTRETADFSAITTWGIFHLIEEVEDNFGKKDEVKVPHFILLHGIKGRYEFHQLRDLAKALYEEYKPDACVIEQKASGQSLTQELRRAGLPVAEYRPDKDKVARAYSCQPILESKRLWMKVNKQYSQELMDEALAFPYGAHDDYVDTLAQAILWVRDTWKLTAPTDQFFNWRPERPRKRQTYWTGV